VGWGGGRLGWVPGCARIDEFIVLLVYSPHFPPTKGALPAQSAGFHSGRVNRRKTFTSSRQPALPAQSTGFHSGRGTAEKH
jgi:hypothetical protein